MEGFGSSNRYPQSRGGGQNRGRGRDTYHPYARQNNRDGSTRREGKDEVAAHYNARPQVSRSVRQSSPILHLKNFNNWVKSLLIHKFSREPFSPPHTVLDLCCGKGGDLLKWSKAGIQHLVGVDIAAVSVEQAKGRYTQGRGHAFSAEFIAADCFGEDWTSHLPTKHFDLVSCQFALHYAFESESRTRAALSGIASLLSPGGVFFGTVPNAQWLISRLHHAPGLDFGNNLLKIRFEQKSTWPVFGHKYWFELVDAIDDCPEYLLHFPTLVSMAKEYGMELIYRKPFHQIFNEEKEDRESLGLLKRMNVLNEEGTIGMDEWDIVGLYLGFAFRKL
ncbi:guanine-N(7)-methyltransferase [Phlyctochytrium arcticum]|nr:guanine-N(7)-methyltransferase [Phlyctochytrium arcticum]